MNRRKVHEHRCVDGSANDPKLKIDTALLHIYGNNDDYSLWTQTIECHRCAPMHYCRLLPSRHTKLLVNSTFPSLVQIRRNDAVQCTIDSIHFGEYGVYNMSAADCQLESIKAPVNSHMPIYFVLLALILSIVIYVIARVVMRVYRRLPPPSSDASTDSFTTAALLPPPPPSPTIADHHHRRRLTSVDTFRGLCLVLMIAVNYGGGGYWFFRHSAWHGMTIADLVFPWFMFIMGTSCALSFESALTTAGTKRRLFARICRRSFVLVLLGIFVANNRKDVTWTNVRVMGVLQRLAISYFVVASVRLVTFKSIDEIRRLRQQMSTFSAIFIDIIVHRFEYLFYAVVLVVWTLITFLLPVPGCPTGYIGPGGLDNNGSAFNCTGGAAGYIDRIIIGVRHMHRRPTCAIMYDTNMAFDPEGVLGCLTGIVTVFIGLQIGDIFVVYDNLRARIGRCLMLATIYGLVGGVLCGFSQNDGLVPVNKNLWSISFVFVLCSMAILLLCALHYAIDVAGWWQGEPLYYAGMNSLTLYLGHEVFAQYLPVQWPIDAPTHTSLLLMNIYGSLFWLVVAVFMHRNRVHISL